MTDTLDLDPCLRLKLLDTRLESARCQPFCLGRVGAGGAPPPPPGAVPKKSDFPLNSGARIATRQRPFAAP